MIPSNSQLPSRKPRSREAKRLSQAQQRLNEQELASRLLIFIFFNFIQIGLQLMNDNSLNILIIGIFA